MINHRLFNVRNVSTGKIRFVTDDYELARLLAIRWEAQTGDAELL